MESLVSTSAGAARPHFLVSPADHEVEKRVSALGVDYSVVGWQPERGDFARKVNLGVECTVEEWLFVGATDLRFHDGWLEQALAVYDQTGRRFIGTNDMGNPLVKRGDHATHPFVHRSYVEELGTIDERHKIAHEDYWHCWVDNEWSETAQHRGEWAFARECRVEHLHPIWRKSEQDEVYERGQRFYQEDRLLFLERRPLWGGAQARRRRRV
jgi:hypothetical protein